MPSFVNDKIVMDGLTFDDVLLIPAYSEVLPKTVDLTTKFSRHVTLSVPIVTAAMDTVTKACMAIAIAREGGIGVVHKNMAIAEQARQVAAVKRADGSSTACVDTNGRLRVAAGVGVTADTIERVAALVEAGADAIVIDTAHGHSKSVVETLAKVKAAFLNVDIVVGNVATGEAARMLVDNGADGIKVGVGPGSICTTRVVAGVGVPQLSAIYDVFSVMRDTDVPLIADGGLRYSGDIVKALAAGANCVMIGSLVAGTEESPGETIVEGDKKYKAYRGMGSLEAMGQANGSKDRYFQGDTKEAKKLVPEGIAGHVPYKGTVKDVIYQLCGGIRSGMGYCGAATIEALRDAKFTRITNAGMIESHPHDITMTNNSPNYSR